MQITVNARPKEALRSYYLGRLFSTVFSMVSKSVSKKSVAVIIPKTEKPIENSGLPKNAVINPEVAGIK